MWMFFALTERSSDTVGKYNVNNYTNAPLQIVKMVHLKVSTDQAFDLVAKGIPKWFDGIPEIIWNHTQSSSGTFGPGSSRMCEFNGDTLIENILVWEDNKIYAYSVDMEKSTASLPMSDHIGFFIVEDDGVGGSVVTWRQYFNRNIHVMSPMLVWMMDSQLMEPALEKLVQLTNGEMIEPNVYPEL
ncbi:MAG: SRPBCC family protein [Fibrobacterales bacterium]